MNTPLSKRPITEGQKQSIIFYLQAENYSFVREAIGDVDLDRLTFTQAVWVLQRIREVRAAINVLASEDLPIKRV